MSLITIVLDPPLPSDSPEVFNTKAFDTLSDLNTWADQANVVASEVSAAVSTATTAASTASAAASTATTKASEASSSASTASGAASTATTKAGEASSSASAAAASAAAAAASAGSITTVDVQTHAATSKATPVDADEVPLADSAATFALKKLTWANIKAALKTYFDTIYSGQVQGVSKNLLLSANGTSSSINVSYDELVLGDGSGNYVTERAVSGTITTTNTGAGGLDTGALATATWYSIWRIGKTDGTRAFLFSLSATAPTMPSGYTLKARIGWFRTDGTANKYPYGFIQKGKKVRYIVASGTNVTVAPQIAAGTAGSPTTPTWVSVAWSAVAPPTQASISLSAHVQTGGCTVTVAPNNAYGAASAATSPPPISAGAATGAATNTTVNFDMVTESSNIYWASNDSGGVLTCLGWEDSL